MTDEGQIGEPMDAVELLHAVQGAASTAREMFKSLAGAGFTDEQAMRLVAAYLHGAAGGKLS